MHARRAVERLLAGTLSPGGERRLRRHLGRCGDCRAYYDTRLLLERAFAGDVARPTAAEEARAERRALAAAGLDVAGGTPARPPSPRRRALALGLAAATAAAVLAWWVITAPVAHVLDARGARIAGQLVKPGMPVRPGQLVEVGRGGFAVVDLGGAELRLAAGTALSIARGGREVSLERSKVWCDVARGGGAFRVRTSTAEATVLGTSFVVQRKEDDTTEVRVRKGAVRVADRNGRGDVIVREGQKSRVRPGKAPSAPEASSGFEDLDLADLVRQLGREIERGANEAAKAFNRKAPDE